MASPMQKIEAIIRPERLQDVQDALDELGVSGLNMTEVMGCGRQKGYTEQYRGSRANISLLPKLKVESVVSADIVDKARRRDRRRRLHGRDGRRARLRLRRRPGGADPDRRARRGHRAPRGPGGLGVLIEWACLELDPGGDRRSRRARAGADHSSSGASGDQYVYRLGVRARVRRPGDRPAADPAAAQPLPPPHPQGDPRVRGGRARPWRRPTSTRFRPRSPASSRPWPRAARFRSATSARRRWTTSCRCTRRAATSPRPCWAAPS